MRLQAVNHTGVINEILKGIVDRVTYHNPDNGWVFKPDRILACI